MTIDYDNAEFPDCPARCRVTGICYAVPYFQGKPSREKNQCDPDACTWEDQRQGLQDRH
jgi:hypothetical protein